MKRGLAWIALLVATGCTAAAPPNRLTKKSSSTAADPSSTDDSSADDGSGDDTSAETPPSAAHGSSTSSSSSGGSSSGGSSSSSGGSSSSSGGTKSDVFTGAPAYAQRTGPSTHNSGQDCMGGCHDHGFTFAGSIPGVSGAEIRLVDANGKAFSVYSGPGGNFYATTPWTAPAKVGVRNASGKSVMSETLQDANGGCNGCHASGGDTSPISL